MTPVLESLHEQTIVTTGASSGTGPVTATLAAKGGAVVVLAARDEPAPDEISAHVHRALSRQATRVPPTAGSVHRPIVAGRAADGGVRAWMTIEDAAAKENGR